MGAATEPAPTARTAVMRGGAPRGRDDLDGVSARGGAAQAHDPQACHRPEQGADEDQLHGRIIGVPGA